MSTVRNEDLILLGERVLEKASEIYKLHLEHSLIAAKLKRIIARDFKVDEEFTPVVRLDGNVPNANYLPMPRRDYLMEFSISSRYLSSYGPKELRDYWLKFVLENEFVQDFYEASKCYLGSIYDSGIYEDFNLNDFELGSNGKTQVFKPKYDYVSKKGLRIEVPNTLNYPTIYYAIKALQMISNVKVETITIRYFSYGRVMDVYEHLIELSNIEDERLYTSPEIPIGDFFKIKPINNRNWYENIDTFREYITSCENEDSTD